MSPQTTERSSRLPEVGLNQLSAAECRQLLADQRVGRLGIVVGGKPVIVPVNYAFHDERIVFRTDAGTKLRHTPLRRVAFEIDGLDHTRRTGWSVLVQGSAFEITGDDDQLSEELRRLPVEPFAPGEKAHWIVIVAHTITGQRITPRDS